MLLLDGASRRGLRTETGTKSSFVPALDPIPDRAGEPENDETPAVSGGFAKRARQDSNLRPLAPEASALSTELRARDDEA